MAKINIRHCRIISGSFTFMTSAVLIGPHDTTVMVGSEATFSCSISSKDLSLLDNLLHNSSF